MGINKRFARIAGVALTAGAVTIGGLGMGGTASADDGSRAQNQPARPGAAAPAQTGQGALRTDLLAAAAKKIGITTDALRREMAQGKSVKQIATQRGIVYSDLKTTLVNAEGAALQEATASGAVTQSQANQRVSNIPRQVESFLTRSTRGAGGPGSQQAQGQVGNRASQGGPNQIRPMRP